MVVTFDDLPFVWAADGEPLPTAQRATRDLLRALNTHGVPAIGFVNEARLQVLEQMDARTALLTRWVDAGMLLGNHTFSHQNLTDASIEAFKEEIIRGDIVSRRLMRSREPYQLYFRHPMTRTGDTAEKKQAIESFLADRGYKVAPHTIENMDFVFNAVYVRARAGGDAALVERVQEEYLSYTAAVTSFAEKITPQVFGRDVPQTLLLHANELNADMLDQILENYTALGYRFISLDEAMADSAYRTPVTVVSRHGPTWLWRWSRSMGQNVSFRGEPDPPQWIMDAYESRKDGGAFAAP